MYMFTYFFHMYKYIRTRVLVGSAYSEQWPIHSLSRHIKRIRLMFLTYTSPNSVLTYFICWWG